MRGITVSLGCLAAAAIGYVARGVEPVPSGTGERLGGGAAAPPSSAQSDRAAYEAYEGQLQDLLAVTRRSRAGSGAVVVQGRAPPARALAGAAAGAVALRGAPRAPLTINLSGTTQATTGCLFFQPGAEQTVASDCMGCHGMSRTHPVDFDYAAAAARRPGFYRPLEEVVRRGVLLSNGQVKCVTCHDMRSPWADKIALPPGSTPTPAVNLARPETYEPSRARLAAESRLPAGSAVSPTPLCQSCHTYGD